MGARILIVDDNPVNLKLAADVLEMEGHEVTRAVDAEDAIRLIEDSPPELILMDIALPGMDGLTLTRNLKADARFKAIPVVALSAFAMKGDEQKALDAGCDGYITKPINTRTFPAQVESFLIRPPRPMKLLIVDDHETNLKLLRAQLEVAGHTVLEAGNGVEALQVLERRAVDGVVSDILMPQMDGYRLCLEVRRSERFGAVPFVLYTSTYDSPADRDLALSAGADAYIAKPAPTDTIIEALRAAAKKPARPRVASDAAGEIAAPVLKQYSEALVRKLEVKNLDLARAHEGLVEVEARLSGLIETAIDSIIAIDEEQKVILFNSAASRMFGYSRTEALGRPLNDFMPARFRAAHTAHVHAFALEAKNERHMAAREVSALRRDGTEFPIEASISKLDTSHGPLYTVFVRDISERHKATRALADSEQRFRQIADSVGDVFFLRSPDGSRMDYINLAYERIWGRGRDVLYATPGSWVEAIHPDDRAAVQAMSATGALTGAFEIEFRIVRPDGSIRWIESKGFPVRDDSGKTIRIAGIATDVTEHKKADARIRSLNRVYRVLSGINTLIVRAQHRDELFQEACRIAVDAGGFRIAIIGMIDPQGEIVQIVAKAGGTEDFFTEAQAVLTADTVHGRGASALAIQTLKPAVFNDIARDAPQTMGPQMPSAAGFRSVAVLPLVVDGKALGIFSLQAAEVDFFNDDEMKLLRELAGDISFAIDHLAKIQMLNYAADYDAVTGLPNRRLFTERLSQRMDAARGKDELLAVVLVDMERFRRINETLGRAAGDDLLRMVAGRLKKANPSAARLGVDMFAFKVIDRQSAADVARVLEEISTSCFGQPFTLSGQELRIGCRGGVAVFPGDGDDAETLLRNAEAALHRAKAAAEHCVFYAPAMNARAAEALATESKLRLAIERREFVLHYQPKVDLAGGRVVAVEALIRWQSPERGLVPPLEFIPILEESGLIGAVGEWALGQALADARRWRAAGFPLRVAVNVSPLQLRRSDFAALIAQVTAEGGAALLELEITESVIMEDVDRNVGVLKQIRDMGVAIAIDDFGTGYSSLAYIAKFPVTSLKIDRTFILGMTKSPEGMAIVSSIVALAHALNLQVIAEGVETEEQARLLRLLRCDAAQGYLYSKAIPSADLETLLSTGATLPVRKPA